MSMNRLAILGTTMALLGCGGTQPDEKEAPCALAESNATGRWVTVVNNTFTPPEVPDKYFFSFNQPSINGEGVVVFRGRAKPRAGHGGSGGETHPHRGVWSVDLCASAALRTVLDTTMQVPEPNNTGSVYNETPSIPRIDLSSPLIATRGNSPPVWSYVDTAGGLETRAGTTGVFTWRDGALATGVTTLGNVPGFAHLQVPGAAPPGTKFDVFPGSPTISGGRYIAFKGNYTVTEADVPVGKTGVYFRDISAPSSPVVVVADTTTPVPGLAVTFGSTAPPSAAAGNIVFTGLDYEPAPTAGGIYVAPLAERPALKTVRAIGDPVPDREGFPLGDGSTFAAFGEGLGYDGRYVSFWGAWGTEVRDITLVCPTDGNKARIQYCLDTSEAGGITALTVPVNQGIFLHDTLENRTLMVARSGEEQLFHDFLYWVYSGRPPGSGNAEDDSDGEPPRWRSSAFTAVDGERGVVFKGSRVPGPSIPESGVYATAYVDGALGPVGTIVEVGDLMGRLDPIAPLESAVLSVGIEREALRKGWLVLTLTAGNPAGESWAGIYATHLATLKEAPPTN